jgi:hypothetical protein
METALEEAMVSDFEAFQHSCTALPDPNDAHVVAAALKTQAFTIVTDNLKDFPPAFLVALNLEARFTDSFLADKIALEPGRAVAAIRKMRERFKKPEVTAERLLIRMEAEGVTQTVDVLRAHALSLTCSRFPISRMFKPVGLVLGNENQPSSCLRCVHRRIEEVWSGRRDLNP